MIERLDIQDSDHKKIRVGPLRDGGYVLPVELLSDVDLIMVFGVSNDVDFELDYLARYPTTQIYLYDHTIDSLPEAHTQFNYKKLGVGPRQERDLNTLTNFLEEVDPNNDLKKILKMDIEFNEWKVIEDTPLSIISQFDLIVIEIHLVFVNYLGNHSPYFSSFFETVYGEINKDLAERYIASIEKLQKTHAVVHAHVNNSLPPIEINLGSGSEKIPQLVELTLIRRDLARNTCQSDVISPLDGVDFPNKSDRPDFDLFGNMIL